MTPAGLTPGRGRLQALGLLLLTGVTVLLFAAPEARAGIYSVYQCYGTTSSGGDDFSYSATDSDFTHSDTHCPGSADHVSAVAAGGATIGAGRHARWTIAAPPGTALLAGSTINARIDEAGGLRGNLYGVQGGTAAADWSDGAGGDTGGAFRQFTLRSGRSPYSSAFLQLRCASSSSCRGSSSIRLQKVVMRVDDRSPPQIRSLAGPFDGDYHSGNQPIAFTAHDDGGGIRTVEVRVNGAIAPTKTYADCAVTSANLAKRMSPCARDRQDSLTILSSNLQNGVNRVQLCARDFENSTVEENLGCSEERELRFDDRAPANPRGLTVEGGADWRATNSFDLSWVNEPQGFGAPIERALYRITGPGGYDSGVRQGEPGEVDRLQGVQLPAVGDYLIDVWLEDAAGNQSEVSAESAHLRFDDTRPPDTAPHAASGWIARSEFPHRQTWDRIAAVHAPPSGIKGYAIAVGDEPGNDPCEEPDRCSDEEINFRGPTNSQARVPSLAQGSHWVHVVAVSGAGLKSGEVRTTELRVDRTDPVSTLHGAPAGWTRDSVALSVHATDALSGMTPEPGRDDGQPLTAIQIDGGPVQTALTPNDVTAGISAEGRHAVRYWARDLAGNANNGTPGNGAPGMAEVSIDRSAPGIAFADWQDPEDLELLRAPVSDALSGVMTGLIGYRRAGSSDAYKELPTQVVNGSLQARFPSASEPTGSYEFRATATDAAGNPGATTLRQDGRQMVLANPIKMPTAIAAAWDTPAARADCRLHGGRTREERERDRRAYESCLAARSVAQTTATVGYGARVALTGTLRDLSGQALTGERIEVEEQLDEGSTDPGRTSIAFTDSAGRYSASLAPGPSRDVSVRFAGTSRHAAASTSLRANVPAQVALSLRPGRLNNGQFAQFRGGVGLAGASLPPGGKLIQIQFYDVLRKRWRDVNLLETAGDGSFSDSYQFRTVTARAQRFKFRAFARAENGWPFAAAASPSRTVTVYP